MDEEEGPVYRVEQVSPGTWLIKRMRGTLLKILPFRYTSEGAAAMLADTLNGISSEEV